MSSDWILSMEKAIGYMQELAGLWYWKDSADMHQRHQLDSLKAQIDICKTCINKARESVEDNQLGHA